MKHARLVGLYAAFAVVATLANLATQRLFLHSGDSIVRYGIAVLAGTAVGLIIKFKLDQRWIFMDRASSIKKEGSQFVLYSFTGVFTTLIFWSTETLFWLAKGTVFWREAGAILGLTIGYILKYQLDKRLVFTTARPGVAE